MFRAWYKFFIFVKEMRKEAYPAPPFCAPGLSASLVRKTGRFGTLPSAPKFPRGKETRAGFQNRDFSDFCQFRSSENRVSEVFQARKTAKRQKNGNLRLAPQRPHHTPAASTPAGSGEAQRGWGVGGGATRGRVRTHHAPRFQALTLFAEYPVQAGVRCGGEAACGAAARRIDSGAHQDWHVCVQVGMRCVRHGPRGMVC